MSEPYRRSIEVWNVDRAAFAEIAIALWASSWNLRYDKKVASLNLTHTWQKLPPFN